MLRHAGSIALQKSNQVEVPTQVNRIEVFLLRLFGRGLGFLQAIQVKIDKNEVGIVQAAVGIEAESFVSLRKGLLILAARLSSRRCRFLDRKSRRKTRW